MLKKFFTLLLIVTLILSCTTVAVSANDDLELLPEKKYEVGDVDMDGTISVTDVTELQMHLARLIVLSDAQFELADTDFDGIVSVADATRIQLHLAGLAVIEKPQEDDDKPIELPFVPAC